MSALQRFFACNAPGVIFEQFQDETVVINLDSGHYYTLDPVGAAVWQRLTEGAALQDVVHEVGREYDGNPDAIAESIRAFVELLLSEQLLRPVTDGRMNGTPRGAAEARNGARTPFRPPQIEKYDDMAEMLLLDPVHDVDAAGWPSVPTASASEAPAQVETDDVSEWPVPKRDG